MDIKKAWRQYQVQGYNCSKGRKDKNGNPIQMLMTFEQWCTIWNDSGKWELRGPKKGQYVMSRINDLGHYELGNVIIQTGRKNLQDIKPFTFNRMRKSRELKWAREESFKQMANVLICY